VVRMWGKEYEVAAEVVQLSGFSAHADEHDLLRMAKEVQGKTNRFFLVHGEEEARQLLKPKLEQLGFAVETPLPGAKYEM
ncbi:MAG: MBL fold metallo-hydrolase RNA specificity domain-containing protein, partial [Phycisphaerae bacterium]